MATSSEKITEFLKLAEDLNHRSSGNSKSKIFTERARLLIVSVYAKYHTNEDGIEEAGEWTARPGKDTSKADALIALGLDDAIYGAGRNFLQ